jgi:TRAP-type C4-dicarboxylate transport system permease small subunit
MIIHFLQRALGLALALILFSMMTLTFIDVIGRYFFSSPVPGAFELTQLGIGLLVFTALPLATASDEHVTITILDGNVPAALTRWQIIVADLFSAVVLVVLGWRMFRHGEQLGSYNETTTFLHIPFAPFVYVMSVMAIAAGFCALMLAWRHSVREPEGAR